MTFLGPILSPGQEKWLVFVFSNKSKDVTAPAPRPVQFIGCSFRMYSPLFFSMVTSGKRVYLKISKVETLLSEGLDRLFSIYIFFFICRRFPVLFFCQ